MAAQPHRWLPAVGPGGPQRSPGRTRPRVDRRFEPIGQCSGKGLLKGGMRPYCRVPRPVSNSLQLTLPELGLWAKSFGRTGGLRRRRNARKLADLVLPRGPRSARRAEPTGSVRCPHVAGALRRLARPVKDHRSGGRLCTCMCMCTIVCEEAKMDLSPYYTNVMDCC